MAYNGNDYSRQGYGNTQTGQYGYGAEYGYEPKPPANWWDNTPYGWGAPNPRLPEGWSPTSGPFPGTSTAMVSPSPQGAEGFFQWAMPGQHRFDQPSQAGEQALYSYLTNPMLRQQEQELMSGRFRGELEGIAQRGYGRGLDLLRGEEDRLRAGFGEGRRRRGESLRRQGLGTGGFGEAARGADRYSELMGRAPIEMGRRNLSRGLQDAMGQAYLTEQGARTNFGQAQAGAISDLWSRLAGDYMNEFALRSGQQQAHRQRQADISQRPWDLAGEAIKGAAKTAAAAAGGAGAAGGGGA